MLRNYFKTAWRSFTKNRAFSCINIAGLALGLASSLLIFLWVHDEKNIDSFHKNGALLFQVYERNYNDGGIYAGYPTQGMLAGELKRLIPGIAYAAGCENASPPGSLNTFKAGEKISKFKGMFAGADFFRMFSFPLVEGNAVTAISDPGTIAISETFADFYFGSSRNAIGKLIRFDDAENLQVTAVFRKNPASSLQFDFLRSWVDFVRQNDWVHNWGNTDPQTFVQLQKGADPEKVGKEIKDFIYRYQPKTEGLKIELALQPYRDRYLYSNFKDGYISGGRIEYVQLFSIIALFTLLIACINFMNLATARSAYRAKEVGVRKVTGAGRKTLVIQFLSEAFMLVIFGALLALAIVQLVLPMFNQLTGKQLALPVNQLYFWLIFSAGILATAIVSGCYPAFFMSSLKPISVLKGVLKFSSSNRTLRKSLVVFQFTLSIALITATIVILQQMKYVQQKNLGYNRDNLVYIPIEGDLTRNYTLFKEEAEKNECIASVSKMRNSPTEIQHHTYSIDWPGKDPNLNVSFADGVVGYDFVKTMQLKMLSGRDFDQAYADSTSFLLNETAVRKIGLKNPIGSRITWGNHPGIVTGVIKDFHFSSLHQAIEPLIIRLDDNWGWGTILVRIKAGETRRAITLLETLCKRLNPAFPFSYQFSDQEYARQYRSEQVVSVLAELFSSLAILISSLGLFGLALFTAEQRSKEIGIRKVLGASVRDIVQMLMAGFLQPVAIAFFLAVPLTWYAMQNWLNNFQYRIAISWWMFAMAGLTAIAAAIITVCFQSFKAAVTNPVESLRTE